MNNALRKLYLYTIFFGAISTSTVCYGDTLLIDALQKQPANNKGGVLRPAPGMSADQVRERFGTPIKQSKPVGNPPISRWTYEKFIVVLEKDHVINSVLLHVSDNGSE